MIAEWMAYAFVIALLVTLAGLLLERIAIMRRLASRGIWISALLLSLLLPALVAWQGSQSSSNPRIALATLTARDAPPRYTLTPIAWLGGDATQAARQVTVDTVLIASWSVASLLVLATLVIGWLHLRRQLRVACEGAIDGVPATITDDIGPAVVGVLRPRIVIPRWLLAEDAATRSVVVAHELEHLRAHDVRVLGGALLVASLLPWNLPIWWQLRKLRFAMEVDCDDRVLRAGGSPSSYGAVLLHVATRLVPLRAAAAGLSESASSLEKRIRVMHAPMRDRWRLLAVGLASCSVALIATAANITAPQVSSLTAAGEGGLPLLPTPVATQQADEAQLAGAVTHFFPELLQPQEKGRPYVWAVVNERGEVSHIEMSVSPWWDKEDVFERNWHDYLQRAGVTEPQIRQQLVMHVPVGAKYVVVAWAMVHGTVARDASAPTFDLAPKQAETMEARMLATVDAQRRVIEHFDPLAISEGIPRGQEVWILIDPVGHVLRAGRRTTITDPQAARRAMKQILPDVDVGYVARGTIVKDVTGKRVPVSWQWLERAGGELRR
jgi:beta-lactamase regulating signal transducer with metallopeptidase domain